jgi:Na+(H+)/acetate symporter ActP
VSPDLGIVAIVLVTVMTVALGAYGLRVSRTTSDFLVASRTVRPLWNASAIGGEYLSAASFLGIAGLIMTYGPDMLWYPVGYAAGYLMLLLLVAAPLRRSGAYTIPDFAEARLDNRRLRALAGVFVVIICWLYMVPQLQAAGLTLRTVTGAPDWVGAVVVGVVVTGNVASGGMRSITLVQAVQYWLKLTAISVPAIAILLAWHAAGAPEVTRPLPPTFRMTTTVHIEASVTDDVTRPVTVEAKGTIDGHPLDGRYLLADGTHTLHSGTTVVFPAGARVPAITGIALEPNSRWALPLSSGGPHPLYATYSLILATFLGTMGLPHVLVRFYTNPDGAQARRTTLLILVLLGVFYLMPTIYGALGRLYAPDLFVTGNTDAVVLLLPTRLIHGLGGQLLAALATAGAFAAFLSTSSGLTVSVAGVLVQDVFRSPIPRMRLRRASLLAGLVPILLTLRLVDLPVSEVVALAFAVAASSFCPLLVLGVWWRRLTDAGAAAGVLLGGGAAAAAVLARLAGWSPTGWLAALVGQPAAWTVPLAFLVMIGVSLATPGRVAGDVARTMIRMHAPDSLGLGTGPGVSPPTRPLAGPAGPEAAPDRG